MTPADHSHDEISVPRRILVRIAVAMMDSEELVALDAPTLAIELTDLVELVEDLLHQEEP